MGRRRVVRATSRPKTAMRFRLPAHFPPATIAFSPDGRKLAYTATPTPAREEAWLTNHDLYEVDVETGVRRPITTNSAADAFPRYSPDGKWIACRAQSRP